MAQVVYAGPCHFLRLAPELRLLIYEQLWEGLQPPEVHVKSDDSGLCSIGTRQDGKRMRSPSRWPDNQQQIDEKTYSLLRACKLIYREAQPVAYEKTHFDIFVSCAGKSDSMIPLWESMQVLERARSVSVDIELFGVQSVDNRLDRSLLLAQLEDLDRRLPDPWVRRTLLICVVDPGLLTQQNRRTFEAIQWRGDILLRIHESRYAKIRQDPVTSANFDKVLQTRPWYVCMMNGLAGKHVGLTKLQ